MKNPPNYIQVTYLLIVKIKLHYADHKFIANKLSYTNTKRL